MDINLIILGMSSIIMQGSVGDGLSGYDMSSGSLMHCDSNQPVRVDLQMKRLKDDLWMKVSLTNQSPGVVKVPHVSPMTASAAFTLTKKGQSLRDPNFKYNYQLPNYSKYNQDAVSRLGAGATMSTWLKYPLFYKLNPGVKGYVKMKIAFDYPLTKNSPQFHFEESSRQLPLP